MRSRERDHVVFFLVANQGQVHFLVQLGYVDTMDIMDGIQLVCFRHGHATEFCFEA